MAFFSGTAGIVRNREFPLVKLLKQASSIPQQGLAQTQFDGFAVANPVGLQVLANQPQEGFGFLETRALNLLAQVSQAGEYYPLF